ncbi:MAG: flagellar protein FlaG [bacterium]
MESKPIGNVKENITALVVNPKTKPKSLEKNTDKNSKTENFELVDMHFRFKIHKPTNEIIVQIIDTETGEVVREFPPEKILNMIAEFLRISNLIDKKV